MSEPSIVVILAVTALVLALCVTALGATLPILLWKLFQREAAQDTKIETLDNALSDLMDVAGVAKKPT